MDKSILVQEDSSSGIHYGENSEDQEESGWTSYFYDFLAEEKSKNEKHISQRSGFSEGFSSSSSSTSILISDAASIVLKKCPEKKCSRLQSYGESKVSNENWRRVRGALGNNDDALEDTASSPVNNMMTRTQTREEKKCKCKCTYGREKRSSYDRK